MTDKLKEKIANIDFCWCTCGGQALICVKQLDCAAFEDRHNRSCGHPTLDYQKANQILTSVIESLSELAKEAGFVKLAKDQTLPPFAYFSKEDFIAKQTIQQDFLRVKDGTIWRKVIL